MRFGVDIFSGAGGLSLGAEMAGIRISHAVEINPSAVKTFVRNHKDARVFQVDVKDVKASDFKSKKNPIFVVMGGLPVKDSHCPIQEQEIWKMKRIFCFWNLFGLLKR